MRQVHCQGNLKLVSFRMHYYNTNNIGQYMLGLQIDSLDGNFLCTTEETQHQK
jgi:hypothetical protein